MSVEQSQMSIVISISKGPAMEALNISLSVIDTCGRKSTSSKVFPTHNKIPPSTSHQKSPVSQKTILIVVTSLLGVAVVLLFAAVSVLGLLVLYYKQKLKKSSQVEIDAQLQSLGQVSGNGKTIHHTIIAVSYTHLTLPTIYSV